jgi:hypothetical protein
MSPVWASARPSEPSAYAAGNAAEPRGLPAFHRYVEAVVQRYRGRIGTYELWNEPNLKSFYSGDVATMVALCQDAYRTIKQIDPSAVVVSPSVTTVKGLPWLAAFLDAGGTSCADVIGFHAYVTPGPPEDVLDAMKALRRILDARDLTARPIWNTEIGWYIAGAQRDVKAALPTFPVLSQEQAAAYLARSLLLGWVAGFNRAYWYAWDNYDMGLVEADGVTLKAAGQALGAVRRWMLGARVRSCRRFHMGTWECALERSPAGRAWVLWNPRSRVAVPVPASWRVVAGHALSGATVPLRDGSLVVDGSPVLLADGDWKP